jgi:hypothetical protein
MPETLRAKLRSLARIVLLFLVALVLAALLVPKGVLRFLRVEYRWLGDFVNDLEILSLRYGINFEHVVAFALLGFAARIALPAQRMTRLLGAVAVIAVLTEVAQFWIPGRTPRIGDALTDVASALLGIAAGAPLRPRAGRGERDHVSSS